MCKNYSKKKKENPFIRLKQKLCCPPKGEQANLKAVRQDEFNKTHTERAFIQRESNSFGEN